LSYANAKKTESLMIGDDLENDILGAQKWGIDQVFFNPNRQKVSAKATFEIYSLQQLQEIL
jgi:putative hydrolase of the HAD superfamily